MIGIYKIENRINGKVYVGQTTNIEKRWCQHLEMLQEGTHHCSKLQQDYNRYDISNFNFSILEICDKSRLGELEKYYIGLYMYNIYNSTTYDCIKLAKHKNEIILPYGNYLNKFDKLTTKRFLLFVLSKANDNYERHVEVSFIDYMYVVGADKSNCYYDTLRESIEEIRNICINDKKLFEEIIIHRGSAIFSFNKDIFKSIKNKRNCFKIPIAITDLSKIKTTYTLTLFEMFDNNKIDVTIDDFKKILNMGLDTYPDYAKLKQRVIKPIISDFKNLGLDLRLKEIKNGRRVYKIELNY